MGKRKIDKEDKKYIIIFLVIGIILSIFIESGMNIVILCLFMYLNHKYIATTENLNEYSSYEFRDKEQFNKGKKIGATVIDVYIIVRMISMFVIIQGFTILFELLVILVIYNFYEKYLEKKYVIKTNR